MRSDEILPGCMLAALWRRSHAMTAKDIAYRLIRNDVTEIEQGSHDPVITPNRILSRHPDDEFADLAPQRWPSWVRAVFRSVKLLSDESPVPPDNCFRFG